ncbi:MAG: alpha/beta hydrolase [Gaiellaceae bacterium]
MKTVSFQSEGIEVVGNLWTPADLGTGERRPAIVVGHGFGVLRDSLVAVGEYFSRAGYVTLSIDYRTFGESAGEPRGQLFPLWQVEDFRNAISFLQARPEVDPNAVGIWGASFGGAVVIWTAAVDRRVKAVVAEVPVVNGRRWMKEILNSAQWDDLLVRLEHDRISRYDGARSVRVAPTGRAGDDGIVPIDAGTIAFFEEFAERTGEPLLVGVTEIALESVEKVIEFNPESVIHQIAPRPLRIVSTSGRDVIHVLEHIQDAYKLAREPKSLVLIDCDAYDVYNEPHQSECLAAALELFNAAIPVS